ncbi:hypothetical protein Tco_1362539 [Tanacetum coccineum]
MTSPNIQMHNDIMASGSMECPPMLAPGSYAQWKSRVMRYVDMKPNRELLRIHVILALGWPLEEIHVTWAHLEKKRTRLRTYTKSLKDLCIQCLGRRDPYSDDVRNFATASERGRILLMLLLVDECAHYALENQLLFVSLLICLGKRE